MKKEMNKRNKFSKVKDTIESLPTSEYIKVQGSERSLKKYKKMRAHIFILLYR